MSETTEKTGDKTLSVAPTKTLTLKGRGVEQGVVRQSFSHGRTKSVVVEKVKTRTVPGRPKVEVTAPAVTVPPSAPPPAKRAPQTSGRSTSPTHGGSKPSGVVLRTLTEEEQKARVNALADSRLRDAEERKIAEEESRIRHQREFAERAEREAADARKHEEEERRRLEEETKRKAEQEAKKRFGEDETKPAVRVSTTTAVRQQVVPEADDDEAPRPRRPGAAARPAAGPKAPREGANLPLAVSVRSA